MKCKISKQKVTDVFLIIFLIVVLTFFLVSEFLLFGFIVLSVCLLFLLQLKIISEKQDSIILLLQDVRWRLEHPKETSGDGHYLTRPIVSEDDRKKQKEDLNEVFEKIQDDLISNKK
jgi:hypothetical protein